MMHGQRNIKLNVLIKLIVIRCFFLIQKLKTQGKNFYLQLIDLIEMCTVQTSQSVLYREITAVCSEIHTEPINILLAECRISVC